MAMILIAAVGVLLTAGAPKTDPVVAATPGAWESGDAKDVPANLRMRDVNGESRAAPALVLRPANRDVVVLTGNATDRVLASVWSPDPGRRQGDTKDWFPGLKNPAFSITGSGPSTYSGIVRPAIHCFTIVERKTDKAMKWYVQVASKDDHFMTRSAIGWDGDYIAGLLLEAAGYARDRRSQFSVDGKKVKRVAYQHDRVTACIQIRLRGAPEITFIFVSYDDRGQQVPAFAGRVPFTEYVKGLQAGREGRPERE